ncbi:hypothetical protein RND81_11G069700 [Saponaria officinalis]|uniref:Gnk2-homologous domain-containing protein n=1 Tax=Saponaria officinalis TaxID=3572 RepID=A0AAW1HJV9_SAPOF
MLALSFTLSSLKIHLFLLQLVYSTATTALPDTYVYGGCLSIKYAPNIQYEYNVNSLLTTLVNSAMYTPYNKFTTGSPNSPIYGLYQCRGDLSQSECSKCVQHALSQLGVICVNSCGGAVQLEGCFIKYDNATFLRVEDKTVVLKKCGTESLSNSNEFAQQEQVLGYLASRTALYRVGESGNVRGVAQCVGDLSPSQCQDCLGYKIQRFKSDCGPVAWGDMFLAKCYLRTYNGGSHSDGSNGLWSLAAHFNPNSSHPISREKTPG